MGNEYVLAGACQVGDMGEIKRLVPRIRDPESLAIAVCWAARHGRLAILRYLFEVAPKLNGLTPDATARGSLVVYEAASTNHLDVLRYLVEEVPRLNGQFVDLSTPILNVEATRHSAYRTALKSGHLAIVDYLDEAPAIQARIKQELQEKLAQRAAMAKHIASLAFPLRVLAKGRLYKPKLPTN